MGRGPGQGADKTEDVYRTIGDVAESLDLPPHVLRFWETRFKEIDPVKRAGGRRLYRQRDIDLVAAIRHLLYGEGYTIKGVQRILNEQGARAVVEGVQRGALGAAPASEEPDEADADGGDERVEPKFDIAPEPALPAEALTPDEAREHARESAPAAAPTPVLARAEAPGGVAGLDNESRAQLRRALEDLAECRRLLTLQRD
jgi:DNA-binding transcriptional MerR regulator